MKKIISLIMVLCIMASLCTVSAFAEEVTVRSADELVAAIQNSSAIEIRLGANIDLTEELQIGRGVHIYTNGYSINGYENLKCADTTKFLYYGESGNYLASMNDDYSTMGYHVVDIPEYPKPICNDISLSYKETTEYSVPELTAAMQFIADVEAVTWEQYAYFKDWCADFSIELSDDAVFQKAPNDVSGVSPADGYLAGQYNTNGGSWEMVPFGSASVSVKGDTAFNILGYAKFPRTIEWVYSNVGTFNCGIFFTEEYINEHPGATVKIGLTMYEGWDSETDSYFGASKTVASRTFNIGSEFNLQDAVDSSISSTGDTNNPDPIKLPSAAQINKPVVVAEDKTVFIEPSDPASVVKQFAPAAANGSAFELAEGATVKILGNYSDDVIEQMRKLVSKDYCVRQGSIIITDSHKLGSDGKCTVCDVQVVSNPYSVPATADNSNMPLWTILFIGFAAVALLTGKKKKA